MLISAELKLLQRHLVVEKEEHFKQQQIDTNVSVKVTQLGLGHQIKT